MEGGFDVVERNGKGELWFFKKEMEGESAYASTNQGLDAVYCGCAVAWHGSFHAVLIIRLLNHEERGLLPPYRYALSFG
jgi:hypothetical protein